jgi:hypothetical protein
VVRALDIWSRFSPCQPGAITLIDEKVDHGRRNSTTIRAPPIGGAGTAALVPRRLGAMKTSAALLAEELDVPPHYAKILKKLLPLQKISITRKKSTNFREMLIFIVLRCESCAKGHSS